MKMLFSLFRGAVLWGGVCLSTYGQEDALQWTTNQLLLMQGRVDSLQINYIFGIENTGDAPVQATKVLMLPREMIDFGVVKGAENNEVSVQADGRIILNKEFPPGKTSLEIGYVVPASGGKVNMALDAVSTIDNLALIWNKSDSLSIANGAFEKIAPPAGAEQFVGYRYTETIQPGARFELVIQGIPKGRQSYWILGSIFAVISLIFAGLLVWRTRPKIAEEGYV